MTDGKRIAADFHRDWIRSPDQDPEAEADLARRIDAALAEWEAHACVQHDGIIQALQAQLAEREAQCVALHGQLRVGVEFVEHGAPNEHFMEWARNADRVCRAIDAAARAFVERIQAEERERCAQEAAIVAQQRGDKGWVERARVARTIEQRIRALPTRRGT